LHSACCLTACFRNGGKSWLLAITGTNGPTDTRLASVSAVLGATAKGKTNELSNDPCIVLRGALLARCQSSARWTELGHVHGSGKPAHEQPKRRISNHIQSTTYLSVRVPTCRANIDLPPSWEPPCEWAVVKVRKPQPSSTEARLR